MAVRHRQQLDRDLGIMLIDSYNRGMRFKLIWIAEDGKSIVLSPMNFPLTILIESTMMAHFRCTLQLLFAMKEFEFDTAEELIRGMREFLRISLDYIESKDVVDNRAFLEDHELTDLSGHASRSIADREEQDIS